MPRLGQVALGPGPREGAEDVRVQYGQTAVRIFGAGFASRLDLRNWVRAASILGSLDRCQAVSGLGSLVKPPAVSVTLRLAALPMQSVDQTPGNDFRGWSSVSRFVNATRQTQEASSRGRAPL